MIKAIGLKCRLLLDPPALAKHDGGVLGCSVIIAGGLAARRGGALNGGAQIAGSLHLKLRNLHE